MIPWTTIAGVVGAVGGSVGIIFGALGIWFSAAAHRRNAQAHDILLRRFEREEREKEVAHRKDDLLRKANEGAYSSESASTLIRISLPLESELDKKAAWELSKEGRAELRGAVCIITVNKTPANLKRGI